MLEARRGSGRRLELRRPRLHVAQALGDVLVGDPDLATAQAHAVGPQLPGGQRPDEVRIAADLTAESEVASPRTSTTPGP